MKRSLGHREKLSFAGWKMDDDSTTRILLHAYSLKELDMYVQCFLSLSMIVILITYKIIALCFFLTNEHDYISLCY